MQKTGNAYVEFYVKVEFWGVEHDPVTYEILKIQQCICHILRTTRSEEAKCTQNDICNPDILEMHM